QRGLESGELVVVELQLVEEVVLRAQRVQLLAGELVALRLKRDAEGKQLGAGGVKPSGKGFVRHFGVALDIRLDVARRERASLGHQEGDERELTDQLVRVVRHKANLSDEPPAPTPSARLRPGARTRGARGC